MGPSWDPSLEESMAWLDFGLAVISKAEEVARVPFGGSGAAAVLVV